MIILYSFVNALKLSGSGKLSNKSVPLHVLCLPKCRVSPVGSVHFSGKCLCGNV